MLNESEVMDSCEETVDLNELRARAEGFLRDNWLKIIAKEDVKRRADGLPSLGCINSAGPFSGALNLVNTHPLIDEIKKNFPELGNVRAATVYLARYGTKHLYVFADVDGVRDALKITGEIST